MGVLCYLSVTTYNWSFDYKVAPVYSFLMTDLLMIYLEVFPEATKIFVENYCDEFLHPAGNLDLYCFPWIEENNIITKSSSVKYDIQTLGTCMYLHCK